MQLYTSREVYSGSSLLAHLNFQLVSGLYKNFSTLSASEFEFLINLIGEEILERHGVQEKTRRSGKPFLLQKGWHLRYVSWQVLVHTLACSTSSKFPESTPFHNYQNPQETTQRYRLAPPFKTEPPGMKRRA